MTAKDYELIASAISDTRRDLLKLGFTPAARDIAELVISYVQASIGIALWSDNPRFNDAMWNAACRGE